MLRTQSLMIWLQMFREKWKGRYIIMDIQDYERVMATIKLIGALESGRKSGEEQGWISSEQLKRELEI